MYLLGRQTRSIEACCGLGEWSLVVKAYRFVNLAAVKLCGYRLGPKRLWIRVPASGLSPPDVEVKQVT